MLLNRHFCNCFVDIFVIYFRCHSQNLRLGTPQVNRCWLRSISGETLVEIDKWYVALVMLRPKDVLEFTSAIRSYSILKLRGNESVP
jgi:hypothetical protein